MRDFDDIVIGDLEKHSAIEYLSYIVSKLDELDSDDTFGTQGWRYLFDLENTPDDEDE